MINVILGASTNPNRYSYRATEELVSHDYKVIPVGNKKGELFGISIEDDYPIDKSVDTIGMYLSARNQEFYYEKILTNPPRRVIFNPGTYNTDFEKRLQSKGVETLRSCVLIMLSRGLF
jgi:uncharacterized protein